MTEATIQLPKLIATCSACGPGGDDFRGGVFLVDFAEQSVNRVIDWKAGADTARDAGTAGSDLAHGLRGVACFGDEVYVAARDEVLVFDHSFSFQRALRCPYLRDCREIFQLNNHLYLVAAACDSILAFDLEQQNFFWGLHMALEGDNVTATAFDPLGANGPGGSSGPPPQNLLRLNSVYGDQRGIWVCGEHTMGLLHIGNRNVVRRLVEMPAGIHNARPFRDGILFNDSAAGVLRYEGRDGERRALAAPRYDPAELTGADDVVPPERGRLRGLCVIGDGLVAVGSSPPTITLFDIDAGVEVARVNFSMDLHHGVHGLQAWPY
jgi:hypothetical protein